MPHHQRHAGVAGGGDDVLPLLDRGCDWLFDEDVNLLRDRGKRDFMMQMRRRGDGQGVHTFCDQLVQLLKGAAARQLGGARPMRRQGIDDPDQCRARQAGQHAGMIAAHDPCTDDSDANRTFRIGAHARRGPLRSHPANLSDSSVTNTQRLS